MKTTWLTALALVSALLSSTVMAQTHTQSSNVLGYLGMARGGVTFGAGYEYLYNGSQGLGGQIHMYQKDSGTKHNSNGYLVVGGFTGFHFFKGDWDFSLAPGVNIINIDSTSTTTKSATTLGPSLQISLTTQLNQKVAIGFDYANYYVWFGDDYRGDVLSDLNFKVKVTF